MKQTDGFDHIREYQRRVEQEGREDSWQTIAIHGLCLIALCGAVLAICLGWVPHG